MKISIAITSQTLLAVKNNTLSPHTGLRQLSEFIQTQYFD